MHLDNSLYKHFALVRILIFHQKILPEGISSLQNMTEIHVVKEAGFNSSIKSLSISHSQQSHLYQ